MTAFKTAVTCALLGMWLLAGAVAPGTAQEAGKPGDPGEHVKGYDDWRYNVIVYGWSGATQADVTARGRTSSIEVTQQDLIELLYKVRIYFAGRIEVHKGPWGGSFDGMFASLKDHQAGQIPILVPPRGPLLGHGTVVAEMSIDEAALSYDFYTSPCLVGNMPELTLEALGGARAMYLRTGIQLGVDLPPPLPAITRREDVSKYWVDPFVGGRVLWRPSEKWLLGFRTDFGGFTVNSQFTFNVNAEVAYKINSWLTVNGGYRALYTDYTNGSGNDKYALNMWIHGPWMGMGAEF
jgi:hypothetical protein